MAFQRRVRYGVVIIVAASFLGANDPSSVWRMPVVALR